MAKWSLAHVDQHHILRTSQPLLTALANISQAHGWLNTSLLCLRLQSALTQSVPVGASPIAQLPGIDLDRAEELQVKYDGKKWAENFAAKETGEAATVAMTWPSARVENAEFKGASCLGFKTDSSRGRDCRTAILHCQSSL